MIQDKIFERSEADNWFLRNRDCIIEKTKENDLITTLIENFSDKEKIKSVIELGSSNGFRLNLLKNVLVNCKKFVGVDASNEAVKDGSRRYRIEMHGCAFDKFESEEKFDLVIVNFVFHWIDRENIFKTVLNTDKLLKDGGYLIIGDFLPDFPQKRKYHHLPSENVFTYKTDYSEVFKSLNTYKEVYKTVFNHDNFKVNEIDYAESGQRAFCSVLRKDLYGYYYENSL